MLTTGIAALLGGIFKMSGLMNGTCSGGAQYFWNMWALISQRQKEDGRHESQDSNCRGGVENRRRID